MQPQSNLWANTFVDPLCILPVPNLGAEFKSAYLRDPEEFGDKIADSCVSAKVLFFLQFLWWNIFLARRNLILKIDVCELNNLIIFRRSKTEQINKLNPMHQMTEEQWLFFTSIYNLVC